MKKITTNIDYRILREMDEHTTNNLLYTIRQECAGIKVNHLLVDIVIMMDEKATIRAHIYEVRNPHWVTHLIKTFDVSPSTGLILYGSMALNRDEDD